MTCCFSTKPISQAQLDPAKRVNYSLGLVLGEEEFKQEQFYFVERGRLRNRLLHGYGTVNGLAISVAGAEVTVAPGWAVDGLGREIRVDQDQCADLDKWLARKENRKKLEDAFGPLPGPVTSPPGPALNPYLYLVMSYRECGSDDVPIPGEPCRSEGDSMAPSRITETFDLRFMVQKPSQLEEEAVRLFSGLLSRVHVDPGLGGLTAIQARAALDSAVRSLIDPLLGIVSSPPSGPSGPLYAHPDWAEAAFERIMLLWATELRPKIWRQEADRIVSAEGCPKGSLLLGRLDFAVVPSGTNLKISGPIAVDERERPYLLSTRMLQELVLRNGTGAAANPVSAAGGAYAIVAAGLFSPGGAPIGATYNSLKALGDSPPTSDYLLAFPDYVNPALGGGHVYIVKGTVQVSGNPPGALEFLGFENGGIRVRLAGFTGTPIPSAGFMVEISRFGGAG